MARPRRSRGAGARALLGCAALLLPLALLAGCRGDDKTLDALAGPTYERTICVSSREADEWTVGVATATNSGGQGLTVTGVELTGADGIRLAGTDLIVVRPDDQVDSFGVWNGYPPRIPARERTLARLWESRTPATGADLPASGDDTLNFVAHLTGADGATSGPLKVTYRDADGNPGSWTSNVAYAIRRTC